MFILLLGLARSDAAECVHDIIPAHWIASHGVAAPAGGVSQTAYIFPSWRDEVAITISAQGERKAERKPPIITRPYKWHGEPAEDAKYPAKKFLKEGNRIPPQASYCLECGKSCRERDHGHRINIVRAKGSADLTFSCDEDTVEDIRTRSFPDFQALQRNFEKWLLHQADPVCCLSGLFGKARDRFIGFDTHVGAFWLEVLKTANFATRKNLQAIGKPVPTLTSTSDTGMDSILLIPGLHLRINWGGVVLIPLGDVADTCISRQAVTGSSEIDILERNGKAVLWPVPSRMQNVSTDLSVLQDPAGVGENVTEFGTRSKLEPLYERGILPVYNDSDLCNRVAFQKVSGKGTYEHLILFTPRTYPKADGVGAPPTSALTSPSRSRNDEPEQAFMHCPMLIGTTKDFDDADMWPRSRFSPKAIATDAKEDAPAFRAMVFGDQTSVHVQVPLTINGSGVYPYPAIGTTVWDVLETRAPRVLAREDVCTLEAPLLTMTRVRPGASASEARLAGIYRFFCVPRESLSDITITPADSFLILP